MFAGSEMDIVYETSNGRCVSATNVVAADAVMLDGVPNWSTNAPNCKLSTVVFAELPMLFVALIALSVAGESVRYTIEGYIGLTANPVLDRDTR